MLEKLMDNGLSRRIGAVLERDHNCLLGTRNTMRLARTYNRLKCSRYTQYRRHLHAHQLEELYRGNESAPRPAGKMNDGWALDRSKTLAHLDQLLADSQQIIAERGGVHRGGGERAFFQQILTDEYITRYPSILDFATSNQVLKTIIDYMGLIPVLSVSKPLGVRLNESDVRFAEPSEGTFRESQLFHRDYHDAPMVYVIVTLRDVTDQSGPFSLLPAEASRRATKSLGYGKRGRPYRITDEQMYAVVSREGLVEFACPAGSVLFLDSNRCFHYGSRDAVIPRYLMMYAYVSVRRTDFGNILRKESPTPVSDVQSRTQRMKYPIQASDSQLRRLLLDREYLGEE